MITDERIHRLRKQLRRGTPQGEIIEVLKKEGYSDEEIERVFPPHRYDMRSWYLAFAILLLLVAFGALLAGRAPLLLILLSGLLFAAWQYEKKRLKEQEAVAVPQDNDDINAG